MEINYRKLTESEIEALRTKGNRAEKWDTVLVKEGFIPDHIQDVHFQGRVRLGVFKETMETDDCVIKASGLNNAFIQDCTIDDNVYIANVRNLVRYDIQSNVVIENVASLIVSGETTFGNGTRIEVINEGGGRETAIFDRLTSQIGYLQALYRHDSVFIEKLNSIIDKYVETKKGSRGIIGRGARIVNSLKILNVTIGEYAVISGALRLEEGTVVSSKHDPTLVGEGVVAKYFIILSGSRVDGSSTLDRCFVGQGVRIGKQFSAENSCFFANSEGFHGEASCVFAGPYTVTHHKSTLLIAGLFSFFNAGSGSNQSNHMYKLGPLHQGILERGVKTGSFSYMMWPCRVGAFTVVIGKHYANFDTADLTFSYILESGGKTVLIPAMNLCTVGTRRDSMKWPARDRRKGPEKHDLLHFDQLSPYTVGKMIQGIQILKTLDEKTPDEQTFVEYNGVMIKRSKLKVGYKNYETVIDVYIGGEVVKRLEDLCDATSLKDILNRLYSERQEALDRWVDMSGMFAPKNTVDNLLESMRTDQITSLDDLIYRLKIIHQDYEEAVWAWCQDLIQKRMDIDFKNMTKQHLIQIVDDWKKSSLKFNSIILEDAKKEFSEKNRIGYGIDGDEAVKNRDFEAVLGKFEENKFVTGLSKESETIEKRAKDLIAFLKML